MAGFLFSDEPTASIGQIQQRANQPYRADPAKNVQGASSCNGPKSANEGYGKEGGIGKSYPIAQNKSGAHCMQKARLTAGLSGEVVRREGIEPAALGLKVPCSTS